MKKKKESKNTYSVVICILIIMVIKSNSFCEIAFQNNTQNSLLNGCQMCYLTFNNQNNLYKCKKYVNCSESVYNNQDLGLNSQNLCSQETDDIYEAVTCLSQCCLYFSAAQQSSKPVYQTNFYCTSAQSIKQISQLIGIALIVVILIIFLGMIIYCCKYLFKSTYIKNQNCKIQPKIQLQKYNIEQLGPYHMEQNEKCAICLQEFCNLYTKCGHYYHPSCFAEWILKQNKCPICITHQFNPVKIYCLKCKIGVKLGIFYSKIDGKQQQVKQYQQMICQFCRKQPIVQQQHISIIHFQSQERLEQNMQVQKHNSQISNDSYISEAKVCDNELNNKHYKRDKHQAKQLQQEENNISE